MIGQWDPSLTNESTSPTASFLQTLASYCEEPQAADEVNLQRASQYLALSEAEWQPSFADMSDTDLINLAFFYVRAESQLSGFEAGARNPAIWVFRYLRSAGRKPEKDIVKALKAETDNRFIPYGNALL